MAPRKIELIISARDEASKVVSETQRRIQAQFQQTGQGFSGNLRRQMQDRQNAVNLEARETARLDSSYEAQVGAPGRAKAAARLASIRSDRVFRANRLRDVQGIQDEAEGLSATRLGQDARTAGKAAADGGGGLLDTGRLLRQALKVGVYVKAAEVLMDAMTGGIEMVKGNWQAGFKALERVPFAKELSESMTGLIVAIFGKTKNILEKEAAVRVKAWEDQRDAAIKRNAADIKYATEAVDAARQATGMMGLTGAAAARQAVENDYSNAKRQLDMNLPSGKGAPYMAAIGALNARKVAAQEQIERDERIAGWEKAAAAEKESQDFVYKATHTEAEDKFNEFAKKTNQALRDKMITVFQASDMLKKEHFDLFDAKRLKEMEEFARDVGKQANEVNLNALEQDANAADERRKQEANAADERRKQEMEAIESMGRRSAAFESAFMTSAPGEAPTPAWAKEGNDTAAESKKVLDRMADLLGQLNTKPAVQVAAAV